MVLYIILFIVLLIIILLGVALIRAVLIKKECGDSKPYDMEKDGIDPKLHAEHLSRMIQVASVSRRGSNDLTKIYEMHKRLEELYPLIHSKLEVKDIDGALLYRWKGKDSAKAPVLLMSHHDVVEAVGEWKYPPFPELSQTAESGDEVLLIRKVRYVQYWKVWNIFCQKDFSLHGTFT